ncbi:MAG TPA: hypothetical protein VGR82_01490 [Methylomirabilota bacterium]|nr:hypothetical protein [Methylomirabilota bacterium]
MAHAARTLEMATTSRTDVRIRLFKADHPRAIDRYIDYFGGAADPLPASDDGACGDALLERLA